MDSWKCWYGCSTGITFGPFEALVYEINTCKYSKCKVLFFQRLAEDSNPAIAEAASKTIDQLKKQWEIEEGDSWRFMMNQTLPTEVDEDDDDGTD